MTIKTLTYIHNLLKDDVNLKEGAKKHIYELWNEAVEKEYSNAEYIREQYDIARDKCYEAQHALEDFEAKEW